ncbi:MAG: hypothetical protein IJD43_09600, partial [Thermoguttaceae bacterium]|nr:hypothetical protein [Thermoguttaceae bacterium]
WQELFFNSRFSQTPMVNPDFVAIANAYGIAAENVETREQLAAAGSRWFSDRLRAASGTGDSRNAPDHRPAEC